MTGSGTELDPYIIYDVTDLQNVNLDLDAYYELNNDIDATITSTWNGGKGFKPIGEDVGFIGHFDGKNYTITNLYEDWDNGRDYIALFGYCEDATILSTNLSSAFIRGNAHFYYVAGFVSYADNCTISGCSVYNSEIWAGHGGDGAGFAGEVDDGLITYCYVSNTEIIKYNDTHWCGVAGFVVYVFRSDPPITVTIEHCYTDNINVRDEITSTDTYGVAGFMVGSFDNVAIRYCYSKGTVTNNTNDWAVMGVAGFAVYMGYNCSEGYNDVYDCYSICDVTTYCDDLLPAAFINRVYGYWVQPPVWWNGRLWNCYAAGTCISLASSPGNPKFCGYSDEPAIHTGLFYDEDTTGITSDDYATGKSTAEMKTKSTFTDAGWDFVNVWGILASRNDGYPDFFVVLPGQVVGFFVRGNTIQAVFDNDDFLWSADFGVTWSGGNNIPTNLAGVVFDISNSTYSMIMTANKLYNSDDLSYTFAEGSSITTSGCAIDSSLYCPISLVGTTSGYLYKTPNWGTSLYNITTFSAAIADIAIGPSEMYAEGEAVWSGERADACFTILTGYGDYLYVGKESPNYSNALSKLKKSDLSVVGGWDYCDVDWFGHSASSADDVMGLTSDGTYLYLMRDDEVYSPEFDTTYEIYKIRMSDLVCTGGTNLSPNTPGRLYCFSFTDQKHLYVFHHYRILKLDTTTNPWTKTTKDVGDGLYNRQAVYDASRSAIYCSYTSGILKLNPETLATTGSVATGCYGIAQIGDYLYTTAKSGSNCILYKINKDTMSVTSSVYMGYSSYETIVGIAALGSNLYCADNHDRIKVFTSNLSLVGTIDTGYFGYLTYSDIYSDGSYVYAADEWGRSSNGWGRIQKFSSLTPLATGYGVDGFYWVAWFEVGDNSVFMVSTRMCPRHIVKLDSTALNEEWDYSFYPPRQEYPHIGIDACVYVQGHFVIMDDEEKLWTIGDDLVLHTSELDGWNLTTDGTYLYSYDYSHDPVHNYVVKIDPSTLTKIWWSQEEDDYGPFSYCSVCADDTNVYYYSRWGDSFIVKVNTNTGVVTVSDPLPLPDSDDEFNNYVLCDNVDNYLYVIQEWTIFKVGKDTLTVVSGCFNVTTDFHVGHTDDYFYYFQGACMTDDDIYVSVICDVDSTSLPVIKLRRLDLKLVGEYNLHNLAEYHPEPYEWTLDVGPDSTIRTDGKSIFAGGWGNNSAYMWKLPLSWW